MNSVRTNYNKCLEQTFAAFMNNIKADGRFVIRAHNPAENGILQDRYTLSRNKCRISIVYETKAQTLVVTAPETVIPHILACVPPELTPTNIDKGHNDARKSKTNSLHTIKSDGASHPEATSLSDSLLPKSDETAKEIRLSREQAIKSDQKNIHAKRKDKAGKVGTISAKTSDPSNVKEKRQDIKKEVSKSKEVSKTNVPTNKTDNKAREKRKNGIEADIKGLTVNTFTIKKVPEEKFNELLRKIKASKNMRYKQKASATERLYLVTSQNEKATLRYAGNNIQLGGSRGDLYSELQLIMSQVSDYKTAINSHIKATGEGKRPAEVEKQLKRKLPAAFEFLSEQSKIDLAIAILDITNPAVVLSDYSTLLIPCFRGLERLIFDLQHAQGIVVKMIGQAYEKENGNYVLKSGYRRKIPSVIYAEVMAALYTEYFARRNFYAHSDGGYDNLSRVISDKGQVQAIFNHIMEVINYNGKKLKEIGFRI